MIEYNKLFEKKKKNEIDRFHLVQERLTHKIYFIVIIKDL